MFSHLIKVLSAGRVIASNGLGIKTINFVQPFSQFPRLFQSYSVSDGTETDVLYKNIDIEIKGHDLAVMSSYEKFVTIAAKELKIDISKRETPKQIKHLWTLLKSVHIYKKHRVQYETRTNFRVIQLSRLTGSTADTFLEYIQRNLPEGMAMKVTRHAIQAIPEHLK